MTILTSLYELSQLKELANAKANVQKKILEIKENATKLELKEDSTQHELKKVALFDYCTKRRGYAIKRLEDTSALQMLFKRDKNLSIREVARERLESL